MDASMIYTYGCTHAAWMHPYTWYHTMILDLIRALTPMGRIFLERSS